MVLSGDRDNPARQRPGRPSRCFAAAALRRAPQPGLLPDRIVRYEFGVARGTAVGGEDRGFLLGNRAGERVGGYYRRNGRVAALVAEGLGAELGAVGRGDQ